MSPNARLANWSWLFAVLAKTRARLVSGSQQLSPRPIRSNRARARNEPCSQSSESTRTQDISPHGARVITYQIWQPGSCLLISSLRSDLWAEARVVYWRSFASSTFALDWSCSYKQVIGQRSPSDQVVPSISRRSPLCLGQPGRGFLSASYPRQAQSEAAPFSA